MSWRACWCGALPAGRSVPRREPDESLTMATLAAPVPSPLPRVPPGFRRRLIVDRLATLVMTACAAAAVIMLALILFYVAIKGVPALNLAFFTERPLPPGESGGGV